MSPLSELTQRLPRIHAQEAAADPTVYAKLHIPQTKWRFYIIEGQRVRSDIYFFGYEIDSMSRQRYFSLSELERLKGPSGERIQSDPLFLPKAWSVTRSEPL